MLSRPHPQQGYRTALGILPLAKEHGDERLEPACRRACQIHLVTYRSIASILNHGMERRTRAPAQPNLPLEPRQRAQARL